MNNISIELLALNLTVCDRCSATAGNLKTAYQTAAPALAALGVRAEMREMVIETEEQAESARFAVSPTVRINGHDIAGSQRVTACGPCTGIAGTGNGIECREWVWHGKSYDAAPVELLTYAILSAALDVENLPPMPKWNGVPENLRRFFRGKAAKVEDASCCKTTGACC